MNKKILSFILPLIGIMAANAQVVIHRSNLPDNGFEGTYAMDTAGITIPASGIGLTWDLSSTLKNHSSYKIKLGANSWFPGYQNFPAANHCITRTDEDSTWQFLKISQTELSSEGVFSVSGGNADTNIFRIRLLTFPATYGTKWNDSIKVIGNPVFLGLDLDSTGPLPKVDSLRFDYTLNSDFKITGWGLLKTPVDVSNALQVTNSQITTVLIKMKVGSLWLSVPKALIDSLSLVPSKDTSYQVWFWTNDATKGWPLLTYKYAPGDSKASDVEWLQSNNISSTKNTLSQNAGFYPNPVSGILYFYHHGNAVQSVNIYSLEGKRLVSEKLENQSINISGLSPGVYLVETIDAGGNILTKDKIIKRN